MMTKSLKNISKKIVRYLQSNIYYSPPVIRYTFLNILGFQVARSFYESIRFRIRQYFWVPHDRQFSSQISENGLITIENFLEPDEHSRLIENIEKLIERERSAADSRLIVFRDPIAVRLKINEPYLNSVHGRIDLLVWDIWNLIPYERVKKYAEDVISTKDYTEKQFEIEYIYVPDDEVDHYDHNTWWHIDRHFHCAKAFLFINQHDSQNGTYEYFSVNRQSKVVRIYYQYAYSIREYFKYIYSGFNLDKKVKQNIFRPRVSNYEYRLLGLKSSPVVAPGNTLVVSDNIAFHRRGKLSPGTKRVQCNFVFYKNRVHVFYYLALRLVSLLKTSFRFLSKIGVSDRNEYVTEHKLDNSVKIQAIDANNDLRWGSMLSRAFEKNAEYILFKNASRLADIIFDVGANYGMFSFGTYPLREGVTLHAFEPNPRLCESMVSTLSVNKLNPDQFRINQVGVSNLDSKLSFNINDAWSGSSSFVNKTDSDRAGILDVDMIKLDSYIHTESINVSNKNILLKIDVEGFDLKALEGAENILTMCSGYILIIELDGKQFEDSIPGSKLLESLYNRSSFKFAIFTDGMVRIESFSALRAFFRREPCSHVDLVLSTSDFADIF